MLREQLLSANCQCLNSECQSIEITSVRRVKEEEERKGKFVRCVTFCGLNFIVRYGLRFLLLSHDPPDRKGVNSIAEKGNPTSATIGPQCFSKYPQTEDPINSERSRQAGRRTDGRLVGIICSDIL